MDSGKELDHITPDGQGQFVFAGLTLLPGLHELALSLDKIMSAQRVSVVIGDKKTQPTAPLVALLSPGSPAQVLSQPDAGRAQTPLAPQAPTAPQTSSTLQASPPQVVSQAPKQTLVLAIVSVEYAEAGTLTVIGTLSGVPATGTTTGTPEIKILVHAGDMPLGTAQIMQDDTHDAKNASVSSANKQIHWQLTHAFAVPKLLTPIVAEAYANDNASDNTSPLAQAMVMFSYQPSLPSSNAGLIANKTLGAKADGLEASTRSVLQASSSPAQNSQIVVVKGDNLWRISRKLLGEGVRYTEIYEANKSQIKDPNLIYPEQKFFVQHQSVP